MEVFTKTWNVFVRQRVLKRFFKLFSSTWGNRGMNWLLFRLFLHVSSLLATPACFKLPWEWDLMKKGHSQHLFLIFLTGKESLILSDTYWCHQLPNNRFSVQNNIKFQYKCLPDTKLNNILSKTHNKSPKSFTWLLYIPSTNTPFM